MITLTDVRNDLRIRKEAESLARSYDVSIVCHIESQPPGITEYRGLRVINVRMRTRGLPKWPMFWTVKYAEFAWRAMRAAVRERAVVYHGHEITGCIPALIAARRRGAKFVYDAHELEADRAGFIEKSWWLRRVSLWCLRSVLRHADHVICASESRAKIMLEEYGVRELPTPILNVTPRAGMPDLSMEGSAGIAPRVVVRDAGREIDLTGKRVVLYQGTLAAGRGLDRVVSALCHLDQDIVLLVLGRGATFDALIAQSEREGTRNRLIMAGQVPADALAGYMRLAHLGLAIYRNTCRNNYYCAPNKIYEYASVGLPVVGPNFPDVESVLIGRRIGRVFDPDDPPSIAKAISEVFADPVLRAEMSRNALALKEQVNWEQQEEKLAGLYEGLLTC